MDNKQIIFPAPVTAQLEVLSDMLMHGELHLQDLPAPLAAFFYLGAAEERTRNEQRIRDLEHECDRLYLAAAHPAKRARELQQRLDAHFNREAEHFFADTPTVAHAA